MKQNKYDDNAFFRKYSQMDRSVKGLEGAGEWKTLERLLPDFHDKHVLDLGCGFGWHCRYAAEHGAASVLGVDISAKMIAKARSMGNEGIIEYRCMPMEDILLPEASFDIVLSSLAFHYTPDFQAVCRNVSRWLSRKAPLFSPWSIPFSPPRERRTGITMNPARSCTGPWTAISWKDRGRPFSWGRK